MSSLETVGGYNLISLPEPYDKVEVNVKETTQYTAIDGTVWSVEQQAMSRNKSIFLREVLSDVEVVFVDTPVLHGEDQRNGSIRWYHPQNELELEAVKLKLYFRHSINLGTLEVGDWVTGAYMIDADGEKEYVVITFAYLRSHLEELIGKFNGK